MSKSKSQMLLEKFHESELESQVISVAEKVAKLGDYSKSIGLLDNLLQLAPKNPKKIAELAIKFQKAMDLKEKEEKKINK